MARFLCKLGAVAALVFMWLVVPTATASAHQPVMLDEADEWPELGPELLDGTVSFAVYGVIDKPGATRGVAFNLRQGDALYVQLLIPNLEPEISRKLPTITVLDPDGVPTDPVSALGAPFDEPFSGTSYRNLAEVTATATKSGTYGVVITNLVPGRFTVAIGNREVGGEVRRNDAKGDLRSWYATAPPDTPVVVAPTSTATSASIATTSTTIAIAASSSTLDAPPVTSAPVSSRRRSSRSVLVSAIVALALLAVVAVVLGARGPRPAP